MSVLMFLDILDNHNTKKGHKRNYCSVNQYHYNSEILFVHVQFHVSFKNLHGTFCPLLKCILKIYSALFKYHSNFYGRLWEIANFRKFVTTVV